MNKRSNVFRYQELSTNAWPAKTIIFINGWVLRLSEGVTKRANSVLPLRYYGQNLLKDINSVKKIYKENKLPVIFQLPDYFEPDNLQETLVSLGYKSIDETQVMTAKLKELGEININERYSYSIDENTSEQWFQALAILANYNPQTLEGQKKIIGRIPFPSKTFCYAQENNKIVGIGLGVIEREYLGIFDLIVHPSYRRKGIGSSLIAKMIQWGIANSASYTYLQVVAANSGALALYNKIGLRESYRYRYLIKL